MAVNPHSQFVAKLENLISSDAHSADPLLLAFCGIASRASPELQQHMILFLINRLPQAEKNTTSLIHHILCLGNAASPNISSLLIDYLGHSEKDVQLTSIFAMRFIMSEPSIQTSLKHLLLHTDISADHIIMIAKALLYGTERARLYHHERPYSHDIAESIVITAVNIDNKELQSILTNYLLAVSTQDSLHLLQLLRDGKSNGSRFRRGTKWDEKNSVYDLVEPYAQRQNDIQTYQHRLSYIWGKKFGGKDINAAVAAGGFVGVADRQNNAGDSKLLGHAVAKATCYDYTLTILEFIVLRTKTSNSTFSQLYANVMGITLKNVKRTQDSDVCGNLNAPLYEGKEYTIFDFTYSIFVVVGTLNFRLTATAQFTTGMFIEFCDNHGSMSVGAGLSPTLTIKVAASGDLEIAVRP